MGIEPMIFPRGRELVLGVGAGIAAYKSCELLRRLQDQGFLVTVVPTPTSLNFVGKATWEALSGRAVRTDLWSGEGVVSHVALGDSADLIVIAPATADLIARIAQGRADDLLTTTVLATQAPVLIVPAMHPQMWLNAATQANVAMLRQRGFHVMEPEIGRLTGQDSGIGRFPETTKILTEVSTISGVQGSLRGRKVLVTTGGTQEALDPVRYIGNRSSGRQGLAIAYEALREGAEVTVLAADTVPFSLEGARIIPTMSADAMFAELKREMPLHDALFMTAAVADAKPREIQRSKIKKNNLDSINLVPNPDLLSSVSKTRTRDQVLVGFAAETDERYEELGKQKRESKGVDFLYVTNVQGGAVFGENETSGTLMDKNGVMKRYDNVDKFVLARDLVKAVAEKIGEFHG